MLSLTYGRTWTILDDRLVSLMRDEFDGVGVSHDVVGDLRVDAGGRLQSEKTVKNLDHLIAAGIPLGGISVLTRRNAPAIREVYSFCGLPLRLLPMHAGPFPTADGIALSPDEVP